MNSYTIDTVDQWTILTDTFVENKIQMILLHGPLGAGKTSCVKAWVGSLGYDASVVQSPTYTYMNSYHNNILHIDMRRIDTLEQFHELGLLDQIDNHDYIAIERPKRQELYTHKNTQQLTIQKNDSGRIVNL